MKRVLRIALIASAAGLAVFVGSIVYAGWKSNPDIPEHARRR
jgi:hypothetical protein